MRALLGILEGKGGVGKSTTAPLVVHAVVEDGKRQVLIFDADTTNSTMASMFDRVTMFDPHQAEAAGVLASCLRAEEDAVVIDTGARSEARMIDVIRRVAPLAKKAKVDVVVVRPLTLSSFAQANAVAFAEAMAPLGVKIIRARILAQGRTPEHYGDWHTSKGRERALSLGAVEIDISDADVRWGDEVPAFGLSFQEVAMGGSRCVGRQQKAGSTCFMS